jgi:hypothetical protein
MVQPRGRPSRLARLRILDFSGNAVDTRRATGRLMLNMFAAMAQFEHEMMLERQREGIAKAKANTDAAGVLIYQVLRLEPKGFRQRRPDGNGGWIWELDERRVLYHWSELLKYPNGTVFICEGEKDADRVTALGHCATTVAAGKWTEECVTALAGRDVIILEDNDDAGRAKALTAAQALRRTAKTIRIVSLPDLTDKGDVSDWLDADLRRAEKLVDLCFDVRVWTPTMLVQTPPPKPLRRTPGLRASP